MAETINAPELNEEKFSKEQWETYRKILTDNIDFYRSMAEKCEEGSSDRAYWQGEVDLAEARLAEWDQREYTE